MPKNLNINYSELISFIKEANAEAALNALERSLLHQPSHQDYYKEVILLSSQLHDLERDNRIGILEPQQYDIKVNQINNALLQLLADLKAGKQRRTIDNKKKIAIYKRILLPLLPILGLIGAGIYHEFYTSSTPVIPILSPPATTWSCPPEFKTTNLFKVLVLPFHDILPVGVSAPHKQIIKRLEKFGQKEKISAQISTVTNDEALKSMSSENEALEIGKHCQTDMVVWGLADNAGENTAISASYSIIDPLWSEQLSDFPKKGSVDTLLQAPLFSTIKGATHKIEATLSSLLKAVIAYKNKDYPSVIAIGKAAPNFEDKKSTVLLSYMEAESHQKLGNKTNAIDAYSKVLNLEPTAVQALNNRAHLSLEQKDLDVALTDFTSIINLDKANFETYYKRAEVNNKLGNLGDAKKDLLTAKGISPKAVKSKINRQINQIDTKIRLERTKMIDERKKDVSPTSTSSPTSSTKASSNKQLIHTAIASNKIGDFEVAEKCAFSILKKQPKNRQALKELIKAKYFQNKKLTIEQLKKLPCLKHIDSLALKRFNHPIFNSIIQNESLAKYDFRVVDNGKMPD